MSQEPEPLKIPFTPEGMAMVAAMIQGMARAHEAQAKRIEELDDRLGFRP